MQGIRGALLSTVAATALIATATAAIAGGFAVRQQSVVHQGASYAGAAAGNDLSAMYWNPAAAANLNGFNTQSSYTLMVPQAEVNITSASPALASFGNSSGDIGHLAFLSSSYMAYQFKNFDPNLFIALSINSPFGLKTDLDREHDTYKGAVVGRESRLLTMNFRPTLAYRITPDFFIGGGLQIQYGKGRFSFATGLPNGHDTRFDGSSFAVGATAGIMWKPTTSTSIGLGWRSQMTQELDGAYINTSLVGPSLGLPGGQFVRSVAAKATLELPNIVTLSLRQDLTPGFRLLGTVEWEQWSRFKELKLVSNGNSASAVGGGVIVPNQSVFTATLPGQTIGVLPANWSDGWFFSLGGEYDFSRQLTLRAGGAYEISPVDAAQKRLIGLPDNDRYWASLGATYKWTDATTIDFSYSHVFVKDGPIDRNSLTGLNVKGNVEASIDIISVGLRTRW